MCRGLHGLLDRWNVRYLIARKPTASHYARPLALRELLDQCTIAEYAFGDFYVARLEPVCRAGATLPLEPVLTAKPGTYRRFRPIDPAAGRLGESRRVRASLPAHRHLYRYPGRGDPLRV